MKKVKKRDVNIVANVRREISLATRVTKDKKKYSRKGQARHLLDEVNRYMI